MDGAEGSQDLTIRVPGGGNGRPDTVSFRVGGVEGPLRETADLVLACRLIPSMRWGRPLPLPGKPQVDADRLQETLASWYPELTPVSLVPGEGAGPGPAAGRRTAAFFTGGVDSFFTLDLHRDEIDALIYVLGFDVRRGQETLWGSTRRMLDTVARAYGKDLVIVETDLRDYLDPLVSWEVTHGAALAGVAHLLGHAFGRVLVSSSFSNDQRIVWGSHGDLDPLWSTPTLAVRHVGDDTLRLEKIRALSSNAVALETLRVCWENPAGAYNCGRCSKCVRTRLAFDALGIGNRCPAFEGRLTVRSLRRLDPRSRVEAYFLIEIADEYDRKGATCALSKALGQWLRMHWGRVPVVASRSPRPAAARTERLIVEEPRVIVDADETRLSVDVRRGATRTTFDVRMGLGGREPSRVGDALLLWFVLPAMRTATALEIQAPVSGVLLDRIVRAQEIWSHLREYDGHLPVPVEAPRRPDGAEPAISDPLRPWAAAFSCGVDSFHTALRNRERIARLVTVHGIVQETIDPEDVKVTGGWLRRGARAVGLPLVEVFTNYRKVLVRDLGCRWDHTFILSKYGLAHFLYPHVGGMLIAGEQGYRDIQRVHPTSKYNPLLDPWTSSNDVRIHIDGLTHDRVAKTRDLGGHPRILDALWVCNQRYVHGYQGGRNCGLCEKCVRTLTTLRILGVREGASAFDHAFDLDALRKIRMPRGVHTPSRRMFYRQLLDAARAEGNVPEIERALEDVVDRFPAADSLTPEMADALVAGHPLVSAAAALLGRTLGRWAGEART